MKSSLPFKICLVFVLGFFAFTQAQQPKIPQLINAGTHEKCGFNDRHQHLMQTDPSYALKRQQEEAFIENYSRQPFVDKALKTIPVVVHVIHKGEAIGVGSNISDAQIQSAIDNMNDAYRNASPYTGVDTEIEFCLAQRDANGNPSTGIVRVLGTGVTNYSSQGIISSNEQAVKALSKWDNTKYYNFWIVSEIDDNNGGAGTQGYAYFPGAGPSVDGAVMLYNSFGYDPDGTLGYNLKSYTNMNVTAVHEMGHALNLYHTFEGDGSGSTCPTGNGCGSGVGDCIADTPPHKRSQSDCVADGTANACQGGTTAGDYQHNFMDYSSDVCQTEFTANQSTRMNATLTGGGLRASLTASDGCNPADNQRDASITSIVAPVSSYCQTTFSPQVTLRNFGLNTLTSVTINYNIDGGTNQVYSWTGSLATGASEVVTLNPVTTTTGAHTFSASSTLPNGLADNYAPNDAASVSFTITSSGTLPFLEDFEGAFPPTGWTNVSNDPADAPTWDVEGIKELVKKSVTVQSSGSAGNAMAINGYAYSTSTGDRYDHMTSPSIDLSSAGSPELKFQVAHAYYNTTTNIEGLKVYISTDCGVNYTVIYDKSAAALATNGQNSNSWLPTAAGHWRQETIDLAAYAGDVVKFRFETYSNYGNNLFIDKINVVDNCASPVFTSHPSNSTNCAGATVTLTAANTNGGTYQWQEDAGGGFVNINDGVIYSGAMTNSLTLTGVSVGLNGYAYRAVVTNGCGSVNSNQATLTVNAVPAMPVINAGGATTFCSGGSVVLTSSSSTGNTWSTGETTQSITVSSTAAITVVTTSNGCPSPTSATTNVTVNATPGINLGTQSNPTACLATDGTVQITGSATGDLSWTGTAAGMMSNVTLPAIVSGLGAGTYNFTLTNACTSNTVSATLDDPGAPATPTITAGGSTTICQGQSLTLTSSSATGNTWSTGETTQAISVSAAGSYFVTVTVAGCSATSASTNVTVNSIPATPTITAGGATTFCSGGNVVLTSSASGGNTWSTGETTQSITVNSTAAVTVTTTVNGCTSSASATTNVTVNPNPSISLGTQSNPTACSATDGSVLISGSGTGDLSWTGTAAGMMSGVTLPATVSGLGAGSYSFSFTNGCASNTVSATLTEPGAPATPTITAGGTTALCTGGSVVLTSSSATGNMWSTGETTQAITVTTAGSFFVTVTQTGCSATSASTAVTMNPIPAAPSITAGGATTFCDGGSVVLTSSASANNLWSTGETTQSITVTSGNNITLEVVENGCSSASVSELVTVNPVPATPTVTASALTTICVGETIDLTSSAASGNTWSTAETTQTITVSAAGNYNVTVSNGMCSATSADITITVNTSAPAAPTVTASGALTFCEGGNVVLTSSEATGNTWSTGETTQSVTVTQAGSYTVSIGSGNCVATSTASAVTVNANPAVTLDPFSDVCNTAAAFALTQGLPAGGTYTVNSNAATTFDPAAATVGANTIVYTFTDANSCSGSASGTITVNDCSAISENAMELFLVYPNPTSSSILLSGDKLTQVKAVSLIDATGRLVLSIAQPESQKAIDLSAYSSGVYTLVIAGDGFNEKVKIHIQK
ncbi:MAG: M43 family zinc metalloprotease [Bacteroidota bacterium]